ncbi:UNVERIFIED_CONTAM: hypothetical protein FKN15_076432 [Acipenser sinensis]
MGDVVSAHLDESKRQYISEKTGKVAGEFCRYYEQQFGVALFNSVRYEIEGNGGPQTQLLHRKARTPPLLPQLAQRLCEGDAPRESGEIIAAKKTGKVAGEFCRYYEQQFGVALFNSVRYEIEGNGGPQTQLLHRKARTPPLLPQLAQRLCEGDAPRESGEIIAASAPLEDKSIFSGNLFQYLEENKKWRNRFFFIPDCYEVLFYETRLTFILKGNCSSLKTQCMRRYLFQYLEENKKWRNRFFFIPDCYEVLFYETRLAYDRGLHPKGTINCAGYKVLTSLEQYQELINSSLPNLKVKPGSQYLRCATQYPIILWHPYGRHLYFCVLTEKEQQKWHAVFQDCVRHANNVISSVFEWGMGKGGVVAFESCAVMGQILSNLVMEELHPELRNMISPRLKGKAQERQRHWILISDAVYRIVQTQCQAQYEAVVQRCEAGRPPLESSIRTDMDQIITSKEHIANKIRAFVMPKAEKCVKSHVQPYISSILDALMSPTSRGFSEVREVFFREIVEMNKNAINEGGQEKLGEHMEKISMLAFHPVKMQSCYEKMEELQLEGLQQRFDVSSPAVFVQRAQILMREQMDNAVYTFEQLLHQSLESSADKEDLCKASQRIQDRVIKKYDYDSSTVRKKFFREALLQIIIPYMLKKLEPSCKAELPKFQELIFEDFSKFILVENIFEEVVLQSVMKDIMLGECIPSIQTTALHPSISSYLGT